MIVPKYWAEATASQRKSNKQFSVRRFGWSDNSQDAAQAHAQQRADEALARMLAGDKVAHRDPKIPYNGAAGVPIREEIIATHGETIITRNSYGALCLNTPNVLFADVDDKTSASGALVIGTIAILFIAAIVAGAILDSKLISILGGVGAVMFGYSVAQAVASFKNKLGGDAESQIRRRIAAFLKLHPDWRLCLYRTPAGFRILAEHRTFDPQDAKVTEFFTAMRVDGTYGRMCKNQHCFRARVSPKPWRIGIAAHMRPRPGVWPIKPERMPERMEWIRRYEEAAVGFASCRFIAAIGSGNINTDARDVRTLHDELAKAHENLPIA
jgi:hypothetical protein